jgi:HNH endonuclease
VKPAKLNIADLRRRFRYRADGVLIRKVKTAHCTYVGQVVRGTIRDKRRGYREARVDSKHQYMHRLIWAVVRGQPPKIIDHKNGDRGCNRIGNLRRANHSTNGYNAKKSRRNTSGHRGVGLHYSNLWRARITKQGKEYLIGYFKTKEQAIFAQRKARKKFHGPFARH